MPMLGKVAYVGLLTTQVGSRGMHAQGSVFGVAAGVAGVDAKPVTSLGTRKSMVIRSAPRGEMGISQEPCGECTGAHVGSVGRGRKTRRAF